MLRIVGGTIALVVALFLVAQTSEAQKKPKGQLPMGWKDLNLTDEQKVQVYKVRGEYKTKMEALKQQEKELQQAERAELAKILTPDQKKKLAAALVGDTEGTKKTTKKEAEKKSDN